MYRTERFSRGSCSLSHRLHAIAELVAVLIAGVGQRLVKADVLAGALTQLVHLGLARWGRQLVSVILSHTPFYQQRLPSASFAEKYQHLSGARPRCFLRGNILCRAVPHA